MTHRGIRGQGVVCDRLWFPGPVPPHYTKLVTGYGSGSAAQYGFQAVGVQHANGPGFQLLRICLAELFFSPVGQPAKPEGEKAAEYAGFALLAAFLSTFQSTFQSAFLAELLC